MYLWIAVTGGPSREAAESLGREPHLGYVLHIGGRQNNSDKPREAWCRAAANPFSGPDSMPSNIRALESMSIPTSMTSLARTASAFSYELVVRGAFADSYLHIPRLLWGGGLEVNTKAPTQPTDVGSKVGNARLASLWTPPMLWESGGARMAGSQPSPPYLNFISPVLGFLQFRAGEDPHASTQTTWFLYQLGQNAQTLQLLHVGCEVS